MQAHDTIEPARPAPLSQRSAIGQWLRSPNVRDVLTILVMFVASRLMLHAIALMTLQLIPRQIAIQLGFPSYPVQHDWPLVWLRWDSNWYASIAAFGYTGPNLQPGEGFGEASYNFFPLMPLLTRGVGSLLGLPVPMAGLLVANVLLIVAAVYLYKYVLLRLRDRRAAMLAVTTLMYFPGSFVFSSLMTESLYLALALFAFYSMEKEQYGRGAVAAGLLTVTRSLGILMLFIFVFHWLRRNHDFKRLFANDWAAFLKILIIPLPVMIYMAYLLHRFGSAFTFVDSQAFFNRPVIAPFETLAHYLFYFLNLQDACGAFQSLFAFASLVLLALFYKKLTVEEMVFAAVGILVPLTTDLTSIVRYCDVIFPLYLAIALLGQKFPRLVSPLIATLAMANGLFMAFWVLGSQLYV